MENRTSPAARIAAAIALVVAAVAIVVVISSANGGEESSGKRNGSGGGTTTGQQQQKPRTKAKTYVVESGDTLISIAQRTGVPVAEILALNPEVDPQILIAGQTLKLR